jgi:hypothetical protein
LRFYRLWKNTVRFVSFRFVSFFFPFISNQWDKILLNVNFFGGRELFQNNKLAIRFFFNYLANIRKDKKFEAMGLPNQSMSFGRV